jgi:hypothetical protein
MRDIVMAPGEMYQLSGIQESTNAEIWNEHRKYHIPGTKRKPLSSATTSLLRVLYGWEQHPSNVPTDGVSFLHSEFSSNPKSTIRNPRS